MTTIAPVTQIAGVSFAPVSLTVENPDLSYDDFERLLIGAGQVATSAKFWIGDLLNYGEARYGERYSQAIDVTGLSYQTLRNYASVCGRVTVSRRRDTLRFSHHEIVASLGPPEQTVWLEKAVENGWSVTQFRDALRDAALLVQAQAGASRHVQTVLDPPAAVDAVRDLSTVRDTLGLLAADASSPEAAERIPAAVRALEDASATVRRAAEKLDAPSLVAAVRQVVEAAVRQTGLADPAYIVPAKAFDELIARWAETEGAA